MHTDFLQLYAVTDRSWLNGRTLAEDVEAALKGGATCIQLREKDLPAGEFIAEAKEIKALTKKYGVPLIINDSIEVCLAVDADGIHVGQTDMYAGKVREMLGAGKILGVTAKTVEQARAAKEAGADYLGSGAMFGSSTKKEARPMTVEEFRKIRQSTDLPMVAIGGINKENVGMLRGCGAQGIAVISGIFAQDDIEGVSRELLKISKDMFGPV